MNYLNFKKTIIVLKKLFTKDFSDLDLSNMDFSKLPFDFWKDIVIKNTNFSNSKINFTPQSIPKDINGAKKLENINFQNVDLSYLKEADFERIIIENTNLKNTGLNINFNNIKYPSKTLYGVTLDENIIISPYQIINLETLELNPEYPFTEKQIIQAVTQTFDSFFCSIIKEARNNEEINMLFNMTKEEYYEQMHKYMNDIITILKKYNRYGMVRLIEKLLEHSDIDDVFCLLTYQNINMHFKQTDFSKEDIDILNMWEIENHLTFDHCTFEIDYKDAKEQYNPLKGIFSYFNNWDNCSLKSNSYLNEKIKKVPFSPFSTHTSLYIKIGNKCNGSCSFCKNYTEKQTPTDIERITNTLCDIDILSHLNEIYFGGGEPSLYLEEIKNILTKMRNLLYEKDITKPVLYFFTNSSGSWKDIYKNLSPYFNFKFILSRHEIEDEKNQKIIGVEYDLDNPYLKRLISQGHLILSATYSDLNMRDDFLQEYFEFGKKLGINRFIIQSLETKTDIFVPDLDKHLHEFKKYLIEQGLSTQRKIVSTSYFDLDLLSGNGYSVALKKYFEPEALEEHMKYQPKHSFDLGMDSNGEMYNDFQMIKKLKKES